MMLSPSATPSTISMFAVLLREHTKKPIPKADLKTNVLKDRADRSGKIMKQAQQLLCCLLHDRSYRHVSRHCAPASIWCRWFSAQTRYSSKLRACRSCWRIQMMVRAPPLIPPLHPTRGLCT